MAGKRFQPAGDSLAQCLVDGAPSFVGSDVTASRDAIAVRLKRGERVAVLGREQAGGQTWLKIAPPSGEFRWVERKFLQPVSRDSRVGPRPNIEGPTAQYPKADSPPATVAEETDARRQEIVDTATVSRKEPGVPALPEAPAKEDAAPARITNAKSDFWKEAVALDLELATMAAREPSGWKFDDLRRDAQGLYDRAKGDDEYDAARHLLGKLAQFESARRERIDLETRIARAKSRMPAAAEPGKAAIAAAKPGATAPAAPAAETDNRYDARGRLVAVQSARPGAAPYAVLDDRNQVRTYISPSPQVNLQAYVGRVVGINGIANSAAGRDHVVAQRVDVLGGPVRR